MFSGREQTVSLSVDASSLLATLDSLKHFAEVSLEVRQRLLSLGDSISQTRSIDLGSNATGAFDIRILFEPSDRLTELLAACLAGDFNGM